MRIGAMAKNAATTIRERSFEEARSDEIRKQTLKDETNQNPYPDKLKVLSKPSGERLE